MGNLLCLTREDGTCFGRQKYNLFLDFENAQPTEDEVSIFHELEAVLEKGQAIIHEISQYRGAINEIKDAISSPTTENLNKAREAICPLMTQICEFYNFSFEIGDMIPKILLKLCSGNLTPTQHLEEQQAIVKQFAAILEFALKFDEYKVATPAIQNDLSFYRRQICQSKLPSTVGENQENSNLQVSSELANRMTLFFAENNPMLIVLKSATMKCIDGHSEISIESATETFSTMARVCQKMLDEPDFIARFQRKETHLLVLRVMVGLIILYDHVHPAGAFCKNSNMDVRGCIRVLKEQPPSKSESLLNALRYKTRHLNDDSTPKQIKNLLA